MVHRHATHGSVSRRLSIRFDGGVPYLIAHQHAGKEDRPPYVSTPSRIAIAECRGESNLSAHHARGASVRRKSVPSGWIEPRLFTCHPTRSQRPFRHRDDADATVYGGLSSEPRVLPEAHERELLGIHLDRVKAGRPFVPGLQSARRTSTIRFQPEKERMEVGIDWSREGGSKRLAVAEQWVTALILPEAELGAKFKKGRDTYHATEARMSSSASHDGTPPVSHSVRSAVFTYLNSTRLLASGTERIALESM